jgi:hypothetical protein
MSDQVNMVLSGPRKANQLPILNTHQLKNEKQIKKSNVLVLSFTLYKTKPPKISAESDVGI